MHRGTHNTISAYCTSCRSLVATVPSVELAPGLAHRYGADLQGVFCADCENDDVVELDEDLTQAEAAEARPRVSAAVFELGPALFLDLLVDVGLAGVLGDDEDDPHEQDTMVPGASDGDDIHEQETIPSPAPDNCRDYFENAAE